MSLCNCCINCREQRLNKALLSQVGWCSQEPPTASAELQNSRENLLVQQVNCEECSQSRSAHAAVLGAMCDGQLGPNLIWDPQSPQCSAHTHHFPWLIADNSESMVFPSAYCLRRRQRSFPSVPPPDKHTGSQSQSH